MSVLYLHVHTLAVHGIMYCAVQVAQCGKLALCHTPSMRRPLATSLCQTSPRRHLTPPSGTWRTTMPSGATDLAQEAARRHKKKDLTSTHQYLVVKSRDQKLTVRQVSRSVYIHLLGLLCISVYTSIGSVVYTCIG